MRPDIILPISSSFTVHACVWLCLIRRGGDGVYVERARKYSADQNWLVALFFMILVALLLITEF